MSDQPARDVPGSGSTSPAAAPRQQPLFPIARSWKIATGGAVVMVLLALLGVGLTTASREAAPAYWVSLVPIYGLICIGTAWARVRHGVGYHRAEVVRQLLHWLGIGVALALDFVVRGTGQETGTAAGLNAMLLLALGCYLAGIHLEWLFVFVGILLSLTLVVVAKAEQYVWLIFVVSGLAVVGMFASQWLLGRAQSRKEVADNLHRP